MRKSRPIYEFRPLPDFFNGAFMRYNGGQWIEDDGEYDLAFGGRAGQHGYPAVLYVYFSDRGGSTHENIKAGDSGMDYISKIYSCANGFHIELNSHDLHIKAGFVREQKSKSIVVFPREKG